jgi:hypothetical protein
MTAYLRQAEDQALADAMNTLLADGQQQQVEQQTQPVEQQPQPEANQAGDDEVVRILQSNPKLLNAINEQVGQHAAVAEAARQQYAQAISQNATTALAACLSYFPEIQQCNTNEQLTAALHAISKTNPQRYNEIAQHLGRVRNLVGEAQRVHAERAQAVAQQQAQQVQAAHQAARQQFEMAAKDADAAYSEFSSQFSEEYNNETTKEALSMLKDYGMTAEQISWQWRNNSLFRSFPAQRLMHDAARYRMLGRGLEAKRVKAAPQVQRPGSPMERGSEEDHTMRKLNARLDSSSGRDQLRAAAELVAARRRNARR